MSRPRYLGAAPLAGLAAILAAGSAAHAAPIDNGSGARPGLLRTLEGHTDLVRGVAVTPDGRRALSCSRDQTVRLWDLRTGRELRRFEGHRTEIRSVAFAPGAKLALSSGQDGVLVIWDVATGREVRRSQSFGAAIPCAVFTPDGKKILAGFDGGAMRLLDAENFRELVTFAGHTSHVVSVALSRDAKLAASAGEHDHTARVWNVKSGRELHVLRGHREAVHGVALSPNGKYVATAAGGTENGTPGTENVVILWDVKAGKELRRFEGHTAGVWGVAFSPDSKRLLTGSGDWVRDSNDKTVRLWDVATGKELHRFEQHTATVWCVAFTRDGRAVSSGDTTVRVWALPR
jgi:WD40 repeat protein